MKTVYTYITGAHHKAENKECQDIVKSFSNDELSVIALCDGAGSKKHGTKAAETVANATIDFIKSNFQSFNPTVFVDSINNQLELLDLNEKNAGTTLIFVAANKNKYIVGHIGDGVILKGNEEGFNVLSAPENGHIVNITYFLPSERADEHFRMQSGAIKEKTAFILSSDGASDFLYDPKNGVGYNACNIFYQWAKEKTKAECESNIQNALQTELAKYTSDDMSIALLITE